MHNNGPIINCFAGWRAATNSRSHSSKNCMAYDEIADLILELTNCITAYQNDEPSMLTILSNEFSRKFIIMIWTRYKLFCIYLDSWLCKTDSQREFFAHEDIWVVCLTERSLELAELGRCEARPVSLLFDRFARRGGGARCQWQRALVFVFSRSHVIGRRRRTLVPGLGRRSGTLQRVLRRGVGYQVSGSARQIRLGKFIALTQMKAVVVVVVVIVAAGRVICSEISLAVVVMVVQKHRGSYLFSRHHVYIDRVCKYFPAQQQKKSKKYINLGL